MLLREGREKVQPFPADPGCSEMNSLTRAYFSGAHGQALIQGGKGKGRRERCKKGREEPTTKASPPENSWQSCWWKSSCCSWHLCPQGSQGLWHGCLGDPGDPGSQAAPHLSSAEQMVAGMRPPTRGNSSLRSWVWGHLSSPALERAVCSRDLRSRLSSTREARSSRLLIHSCL